MRGGNSHFAREEAQGHRGALDLVSLIEDLLLVRPRPASTEWDDLDVAAALLLVGLAKGSVGSPRLEVVDLPEAQVSARRRGVRAREAVDGNGPLRQLRLVVAPLGRRRGRRWVAVLLERLGTLGCRDAAPLEVLVAQVRLRRRQRVGRRRGRGLLVAGERDSSNDGLIGLYRRENVSNTPTKGEETEDAHFGWIEDPQLTGLGVGRPRSGPLRSDVDRGSAGHISVRRLAARDAEDDAVDGCCRHCGRVAQGGTEWE